MMIALFERRWLGSLLFGVGAMDPTTFAAVAALLLLTATFACWLAGRRAAQVHPVEAISTD
jgi:ABC-type lipoprotein release transport system permease subunit